MTNDLLVPRQPKGIPVGGQFATSERAESSANLFEVESTAVAVETEDGIALVEARYAEQARWGSVTGVRTDSRTPWGAAQSVDHPAPGIAVASCAGHGGVKLSPERNAVIPPALRNKSGWYEEDCEAQIVGMYFPETFPHYRGAGVADADQNEWRRDAFEQSVKSWFPDEYTKATGKTVAVEESSVLRDRAKQRSKEDFRAEHAEEFVTLGNGDTHATWIPAGFASCKARRDATGEERHFLVPKGEVIHDHMYGVHAVIDPNRHLDVTHIENLTPDRPWVHRDPDMPLLRGDDLGVDFSALTSAQHDRALGELHKRWRFHDDTGTETIESLGEHMARVGVTGKNPYVDGDKVTYSVCYEASRVTRVSKATYDALTGVPDISSDVNKAYVAKEQARVRYERERSKYDHSTPGMARRQKTEAAYQESVAAHRTLADAQSEQAREWQAERDEMRTAAMRTLLDERGIEI